MLLAVKGQRLQNLLEAQHGLPTDGARGQPPDADPARGPVQAVQQHRVQRPDFTNWTGAASGFKLFVQYRCRYPRISQGACLNKNGNVREREPGWGGGGGRQTSRQTMKERQASRQTVEERQASRQAEKERQAGR